MVPYSIYHTPSKYSKILILQHFSIDIYNFVCTLRIPDSARLQTQLLKLQLSIIPIEIIPPVKRGRMVMLVSTPQDNIVLGHCHTGTSGRFVRRTFPPIFGIGSRCHCSSVVCVTVYYQKPSASFRRYEVC